MPNKMPAEIAEAFAQLPENAHASLFAIRAMIFDVATGNPAIGDLQETLKWGQPSYLTQKPKSGTTIRLGVNKGSQKPTVFVHCQTNLVEHYRALYPDTFTYSGNRALVVDGDVEDVETELRHCLGLALLYHSSKKG